MIYKVPKQYRNSYGPSAIHQRIDGAEVILFPAPPPIFGLLSAGLHVKATVRQMLVAAAKLAFPDNDQ